MAARLPAPGRQPALTAEPHQGDGQPSPLQSPEEGGHRVRCGLLTLTATGLEDQFAAGIPATTVEALEIGRAHV